MSNNPFDQLIARIEQLKKEVQDNSASKEEAYKLLLGIISDYDIAKQQDLDNWKENFFGFFTLQDVLSQVKELLHGYLSSSHADDNKDRNQKLFIANEIENLLVILGK